jgi:PEP-CTERM motif
MKFKNSGRYFAAMALFSSLSVSALASEVPHYDKFGPLAATFGGTGIPNGAVAQSTFGNGNGVLGLTATQRYSNPTVTNNGAGLFYAPSGIDQHDATSTASSYARWNFGFYIDNGGQTGNVYQLFMDVNPTSAENFKSFGAQTITGVNQDSWNLGFDLFESSLGYSFDPTVDGDYTFALQASNNQGLLARTSIVVQVGRGAEVPEPGTLALAGLAFAGLAATRRKQKQ